MQKKRVRVYTANGQLDADIVRAFLESMQIHAVTSRESLGSVYGFSVGPLGAVDIMVPEEEAAVAMEILRRMEEGEFEDNPDEEDFHTDVEKGSG